MNVKQSDLRKIAQASQKLGANIFRSTSLFKRQPKTRQLVIEPLLESDSDQIQKVVREVFPEDRIEIEKNWRRIKINLNDVDIVS